MTNNLEQLPPGAEVVHIKSGKTTTVLRGHYEEPGIGWMLKTSLFPGGYPTTEFVMPEYPEETAVQPEEPQGITFEIAIIEKEEPVKLTAELVRQKLKPLYDLTIENYLDEDGYNEVKKGKNKAVKARTSIEKKEKEVLGAIKARHATEIKQVTDYTAELYKVCLEAQNDLQAKLDKADKDKQAEADRLAEERKQKTEAREAKMFELGLTWNGVSFVGYGKPWMSKESLYSMPENTYNGVIEELEALQMEAGVTGKQADLIKSFGNGMNTDSSAGALPVSDYKMAANVYRAFIDALYDKQIGGVRVILTKGEIIADGTEIVANDRVANSAVYLHVLNG